MYAEDGKVVIVKGLMTFEAFKEAYEPHKERAVVLHFRISTHGKVNEENTHPFQVTESLGLVHNGIINNIKCDVDKHMSDTWHFTEKIAKQFVNVWQDPAYKALVECFIGFSKLIMMDGDENVEIYNESMGNWNSGCWFSNYSYTTVKSVYSPKGCQYQKKENKRAHKTDLAINDIVTNKDSFKAIGADLSIPANSTLQIESFGTGMGVWVICIDKGIYDGLRGWVLAWELETIEEMSCSLESKEIFTTDMEVVFAENFNHFRIGDKGVITSVAKESVLVSDPLVVGDKKNYLVPKVKIRPALILLQ